MVLSALAVTMTPTVGRMATAQTARVWPVRVALQLRSIQTLAVMSQEPDTRVPNLPT
jgi:hypothetical protein